MAGEIRQNRISQAIQRFVGKLMISEYGGTELSMIMIQKVKVTKDLKYAKIYYTFLGGKSIPLIQNTLEEESRQIRFKLAQHLGHLKFIPEISFVYDKTADEILKVEKILDEIKQESNGDEKK